VDDEAWRRAKSQVAALKAEIVELKAKLAVAEEEARKLRAMPDRLSAGADESTMLGQLQRSEKNGVELQTKVIMLQADLQNAARQVKLLLSKAGGKKRR
jgi:septation ring formation regulator EzrA